SLRPRPPRPPAPRPPPVAGPPSEPEQPAPVIDATSRTQPENSMNARFDKVRELQGAGNRTAMVLRAGRYVYLRRFPTSGAARQDGPNPLTCRRLRSSLPLTMT